MPSILEYAETEFSLLAEKPFTDVDSLLLSQFSYMNLSAFEDELKCENKIEIRELLKAERFEKLMFHVRDTKSNMRLLYAMASSPRWRNIKIGNFVEKLCDQSEEQFAAITVYLDDDHACAVFRGTDATLVGWKEDFNMAFLPVIPSQADAADYVTKLGKSFPGKLLLMGHSKGGNLAAYAGMFCDPEIQKRIERVYPLDSPGFIGNTLESEEYGRIQSRVHKVIPKGSLIGMLLENHGAYSGCGKQPNGHYAARPVLVAGDGRCIPYAGGNFQRRKIHEQNTQQLDHRHEHRRAHTPCRCTLRPFDRRQY